jgi:subtilisin family serine protease/NDP-sugar pyrophosphorylase family protein
MFPGKQKTKCGATSIQKISLLLSLILPLITIFLLLRLLTGTAAAKPVELLDTSNKQPVTASNLSNDQPGDYPYAPDRVIVKFRSDVNFSAGEKGEVRAGMPALNNLLASQGVQEAHPLLNIMLDKGKPELAGLSRIHVLQLSRGSNVLRAVDAFTKDPNVEWAEPDYIARAASVPNDPLLTGQWGLAKIGAVQAWDMVTGTSTVVIAVLDTGIDMTHLDFTGKLWVNPGEIAGNGIDDDNNGYVDDVNGWNFVGGNNDPSDDNGHGTQVAGIAGAATNDGTGIAGVCWNCKIMPVKVMQGSGIANYSDITAGVLYAAQKGAKVINLSLGGYGNSSALRSAIQAAVNTYGAVVVGGAGNDNLNAAFYPAAYDEVLAVAGTTDTDEKATLSNYGIWVDVSAPAINITTTFLGGDWGPVNGTSFAAPFVSGLAGLLRSQHPDWTPGMVMTHIEHTTDAIDALNPTYAGKLGSGRINAAAAVTIAPHPILTLVSTKVNGDPQGRPTQGEEATLEVTLGNNWNGASEVTGTLTTTDSYVTIGQAVSSFGGITAEGIGTNSPAFTFTVELAAGYNYSFPIELEVWANGGTYSKTFTMTLTTRSADEPVGGTIGVNTLWTNDKTYLVNSNLVIAPGVTLTIQPGTDVIFTGNYNFSVGGTLIAEGTESQPIRFHGQSGSSWGRIYFDDPSEDASTDISGTYQGGNILRWVQVENATQGIACNTATPYLEQVILAGGGMNCTPGATALWLLDNTLAGGVTIGGGGLAWRNTITGGDLSLSGQATVRDNRVSGGISTGNNSLVQDNTAGGTINAPGASTVTNNTVTDGGITSGSSALVQDNQVNGGNVTSGSSSSVMSNTITGGGITIGNSSTTSRNNIENASGWGISSSGSVTVTYNRVVGGANGVYLSGGVMRGNLVANNSGIGLQINGNSTVISNTFTGNAGNTIKLVSATSLLVNGNNLEGNKGLYDIENLISKTTLMMVQAMYNWWGKTSNAVIAQRIFDFNDDSTKGQILYAPKKTSPIQTAPAYVCGVIQNPASPVGIQNVTFNVNFNRPMDREIYPNMVIGDDFQATANSTWISSTLFRVSYDVTTLTPRGIYDLTITGALGTDNIEIAPSTLYTLTIDYAGAIGDTTPPHAPIVQACASSSQDTLSASWSANDPESSITMYSYAIGTTSGGSDIVNWTTTTNTSFLRSGLGLIAGQKYYISVKARNAGGLWSSASTPPGVEAGSSKCTSTVKFIFLPLVRR